MIYLSNDYQEGAHPKVLEALTKSNMETLDGYGLDSYSESAKSKIKKELEDENVEIFFLSGGTQTNQLVVDAFLDSTQGVIAPASGHINVHEAGAIEYTGHKVIELEPKKGKISAEQVESFINGFKSDLNNEHMVEPGMVYISQPTEFGTIYSKNELTELYDVCKKNNLTLFIDGARLIYALASPKCDVKLSDMTSLCDVFYIGGTKVGLLLGEALVIKKNILPKRFVSKIKQHGALLAKGRVVGVQFDALFTDELYKKIGERAIATALKLKAVLLEQGYRFHIDSPTNQQFIVVENSFMDKLSEKVTYSYWEAENEEYSIIRFATSWATDTEVIDAFEKILKELK